MVGCFLQIESLHVSQSKHLSKLRLASLTFRNSCLNTEKNCFRIFAYFKDTHKEKAPSNKTPALTKSMNLNIWVVGTSNQLFMRGS